MFTSFHCAIHNNLLLWNISRLVPKHTLCKYILTAICYSSHFLADPDYLNPIENTENAMVINFAEQIAFQQQGDANPFNERRLGRIASTSL